MAFVYIIFALACIATVKGVVDAIKAKSVRNLWISLLFLLFSFCLFIGFLFGGSALRSIGNDYELYQAGHYYLVNGSSWTEVSYGKYLFVLISEIVGFSCFILEWIFIFIKNRKTKKSTPNLLK